MNLFENLQQLKEAEGQSEVSNKNQKKFLKDIIDTLNRVNEKSLIPKEYNKLIYEIYNKTLEIRALFDDEHENKSIEEMKDAIHLAYMNTTFEGYVEDFITSHGVSSDSETIFDGLSDEVVKELYNELRNKLIKHYGPDYDELDSMVYDAFNLMI